MKAQGNILSQYLHGHFSLVFTWMPAPQIMFVYLDVWNYGDKELLSHIPLTPPINRYTNMGSTVRRKLTLLDKAAHWETNDLDDPMTTCYYPVVCLQPKPNISLYTTLLLNSQREGSFNRKWDTAKCSLNVNIKRF